MNLGALSPERASIVTALQNAAQRTGSDFNYLLGTAMRESSLKPHAQSATSSATGLFQFIEQTWLGLVKNHGSAYGLSEQASAITRGSDGRYRAGAGKDAILALRKDPNIAALMAGEHAKQTSATLQNALGRQPCGGELYAAHFLGPEAACRLIKLAENTPGLSAASQFPTAAAANRNVFYRADGSAKSVRDVYDWALKQPGAKDTIRVAPLPPITTPAMPQSPLVMAATADSEMQMLLASVMNWQPRSYFGGAFGSELGGASQGMGASALSFGAGLLSVLSEGRQS
jgi:hypothetical protein